ncbi:efflux RND transporter periplasmic adaptor subunit [Neolewinella lacunae]|uniref:Efflux RND transporter periplasmic adaptor subunit n=1 Tax=Neolewinella lacunae TaxID=1517758 RepID=A0A923PM83_9BACT|nr:efflux RND transporter periplasmic adaptor subunit [Neolewinella lacunae]MBC6995015.1 efflux RND transporter periplasmic adaptor subunit [Neolewinella lacunae]MDN3633214.1 efflux RND transporter periplasmic adaptor subunit [Neolewinella lacunae]
MNKQTILYLVVALALGLAAGFVLFRTTDTTTTDQHQHGGDDAASTEEAEIWTCSMHPQIQQDGPGQCPLCGMDLIPLQTGNSTDPTILTMTEAAVAMARVRTMVVGSADAQGGADAGAGNVEKATLELTGKLAADERTAAVEVSEFGGRIERLFVSFAGEAVRAGQRIATVYAPELVVAQEALLQARKFDDVNPDLVAAARAKLKNLKMTDAQIAELESTGQVISNFPVYADQSGTILATKAEVGEYVKAGGALYTYTNLSTLWVLLDAYEEDLAQISVGSPLRFTIPSRPGERYSARVSFIDPVINPSTRTATVRAEINNRQRQLKPEMFVRGSIERWSASNGARTNEGEEEITVPRSAVLWTGERSVVFVELPELAVPTYEFREVSLGQRIGDSYRIRSGLAPGDRVVINGAFQLDAAAQLNNKASMMNRDVVVQGEETGTAAQAAIPDYREATPEAFRMQLGQVTEAYLPLKDQLVATALADAALLAPISEALGKVAMNLVTGEAHTYWMEQQRAISAHLDLLAAATSVEDQRQQFRYLSQALINALTAFGVSGDYYVQHCPMAFGNTGANWLSDEAQIRNPYYGDLMLSCGTVTDEF